MHFRRDPIRTLAEESPKAFNKGDAKDYCKQTLAKEEQKKDGEDTQGNYNKGICYKGDAKGS